MTKRSAAVLLLGALGVNLILFALMERLAAPKNFSGMKPTETIAVDFLRLKRTPPPPEIKERPKPPEKPPEEEVMPTPDIPMPTPDRVRVRDLALKLPRLALPVHVSGMPYLGEMGASSAVGYSEAVPLVRIPPLYPPNALSRRLEGMVRVAFTVDEEGGVTDPVVVASKPSGIFDRSALHAIRKWKFEKKLVDGKPVPWRGMQTIYYRLDP